MIFGTHTKYILISIKKIATNIKDITCQKMKERDNKHKQENGEIQKTRKKRSLRKLIGWASTRENIWGYMEADH